MQFVYEKMLVILYSEADPRFFWGSRGIFKKVLKIFSIFFRSTNWFSKLSQIPILANVCLKKNKEKDVLKHSLEGVDRKKISRARSHDWS